MKSEVAGIEAWLMPQRKSFPYQTPATREKRTEASRKWGLADW